MYTPLPPSSEAFERFSWSAIELWYRELTATPLSPETLFPWLTQWSRLSELVDETTMRLEIAWAQNTADPERARRKQRFLETIVTPAQSFEQRMITPVTGERLRARRVYHPPAQSPRPGRSLPGRESAAVRRRTTSLQSISTGTCRLHGRLGRKRGPLLFTLFSP